MSRPTLFRGPGADGKRDNSLHEGLAHRAASQKLLNQIQAITSAAANSLNHKSAVIPTSRKIFRDHS